MARRWTPQRFVMLRRIRVAICAISVVLASIATFGITARKSVAISVNGETRTVTTYAMSTARLLQEQNINVKSHDLVQSTSGDNLADHAVVTVRSAYQTTINIDGQQIPFWTVATSADQLLGFFKENENAAEKVTVDIDNVYNQLTGGLIINQNGPVTVIADGKTSVAPNGKLPAASILDSKGIILNKEDRVSVEKDGNETILRVQRVTHGQETRNVVIPHDTQTIVDDSLQPGQTVIRQQGEDGEKQQVYNVTYVDGVKESETLVSETTTKMALDTVVAVGPAKTQAPSTNDSNNSGSGSGSGSGANSGNSGSSSGSGNRSSQSGQSGNSGNSGTNGSGNGSNTSGSNGSGSNNSGTTNGSNSGSNSGNSSNSGNNNSGNANTNKPNTNNGSNSGGSSSNGSNGNSGSGNSGSNNSNSGSNNSNNTNTPNTGNGSAAQGRLWHPTVAQAQAYAAGAAAQRGWTGQNWTDLVKLWNRESSWLWYAENKSSGAYGIPQSLPASKMAAFGANYRDDAAVQIDWGLSYIAAAYGNPSKAWAHSEQYNWY